MDYNRIVQEILNIGEELLKSGAEIFRVEDSLYRMCRSYGFVRSDVYASQINIQMTVETPEGEIITQIRYIEMTSPHYDKLDQLNNLSRYVCANTPKQAEIHERYEKIAKSKVLAFPSYNYEGNFMREQVVELKSAYHYLHITQGDNRV